MDLSNSTCIVTGANTGLGFEVARRLAALGADTTLLCRTGFELMFQVNYLAPFMLMTGLLDLLKYGGSAIVVNLARPSPRLRLDLDDLQSERDFGMWRSFFRTKLCLVFASLELARRPDRDGMVVTLIDPGTFRSGLVRDVKLVGWFKNLVSAPVEKAADTLLYHLNADRGTRNGKVFKERQEYPLPTYWQDERVAGLLWSKTESMLAGAVD